MSELSIEYIPISALKPYRGNPRKNKEAVKFVAESIKQFGFKVPIVIDKDNTIVCGHTRIKAAKKLGMESVPCVVADDLTPDQIKAFRLADNKVSEMSTWDFPLLLDEIESLPEIDFSDFGFDLDIDTENADKQREDHEEKIDTYLDRAMNILNSAYGIYPGDGPYDIPVIAPIRAKDVPQVETWMTFDDAFALRGDRSRIGVYFFAHDYKFERIWNEPERYRELLKDFAVVVAPDFSPMGGYPMATQIFNHYRKHWLAAYWQQAGIKVIPCIRSSTDDFSFSWYLDGEPSGGVVCISSMWTDSEDGLDSFRREYDTMYDRLKPESILVYGKVYPWMRGVIEQLPDAGAYKYGR
ncbi:MAG: DUF4417 domain-containing protein [Oscillospiraceae bacterium]|nr:DUF4417 domain-containing protein [Oscillospiraceae bacterium]